MILHLPEIIDVDGSVHVAVADDDPFILDGAEAVFGSRRGVRLSLFENGLELVGDVSRGTDPHLVIVDGQMPKLDGLSALDRMPYVAHQVRILHSGGLNEDQMRLAAKFLKSGRLHGAVDKKADSPTLLAKLPDLFDPSRRDQTISALQNATRDFVRIHGLPMGDF